eukprot:343774-Rhodomonas_salina.6
MSDSPRKASFSPAFRSRKTPNSRWALISSSSKNWIDLKCEKRFKHCSQPGHSDRVLANTPDSAQCRGSSSRDPAGGRG